MTFESGKRDQMRREAPNQHRQKLNPDGCRTGVLYHAVSIHRKLATGEEVVACEHRDVKCPWIRNDFVDERRRLTGSLPVEQRSLPDLGSTDIFGCLG